jgi:hypothetical protein
MGLPINFVTYISYVCTCKTDISTPHFLVSKFHPLDLSGFIDKKTISAQELFIAQIYCSMALLLLKPPFAVDKNGHCSSPTSYLHIYSTNLHHQIT